MIQMLSMGNTLSLTSSLPEKLDVMNINEIICVIYLCLTQVSYKSVKQSYSTLSVIQRSLTLPNSVEQRCLTVSNNFV